MPIPKRTLVLVGFFVAGGCGGSSSSGAPTDDSGANAIDTAPSTEVGADADDASDASDAPPRSDACLAQDAKLQAIVDKDRVSPNALLAVSNPDCGESVYVSGDAANATVDSLWAVGSVTKTFVSTATLSLEKEGKLTLDDPLSKWVPGVAKSTGVTLRMLLDHRSGIFNYTEDTTFDPTKPWTPQQLVDLATSHDPYFAPDADFHYSNTNYVLLGMVLEAVTGKKAFEVLRARAIDVAGLKHTFLDGSETFDATTLARGFHGTTDITDTLDPSSAWTAGAMVMSGADMVHWVATLYGSTTVLDASQLAELKSKTSVFAAGIDYGLGVQITSASISPAGEGLGHDGLVPGISCMVFYFAAKKTAIAAAVNQDGRNPNAIFADALTALFP